MKKIISIILSIIIVISLFSVGIINTYAESNSSDFEYEVLDDVSVEITRYNGTASSLSIPSHLDGYTVKSICTGAFEDCISIKNVTIPYTIENIDDFSFVNCKSLVSIDVDNENLYYTSVDGILFNAELTKIILYPSAKTESIYEIPYPIEEIGNGAFSCDYLENIILHDGVNSIGEFAFSNCQNLKSIVIPNSVVSIGYYAFENCSRLESVVLSNNLDVLEEGVFLNCDSLERITIPNSIKGIGNHAFESTSLLDVTIPSSVISIGDYAFINCIFLHSITIPNSVNSMGVESVGYYYDESGDNIKISGFKIKGHKNSTAENYAQANTILFVESKKPEYFFITGDSDKNSLVDIVDSTTIQKDLAELISIDLIDRNASDVNDDGFMDIVDATCIQKYLAELSNLDGTVPFNFNKAINKNAFAKIHTSEECEKVVTEDNLGKTIEFSNVDLIFDEDTFEFNLVFQLGNDGFYCWVPIISDIADIEKYEDKTVSGFAQIVEVEFEDSDGTFVSSIYLDILEIY